MTTTASKCEVMDGVLAVNKDAGWTSHDVVARVRQLLRGVKVGHAGTLDPAATGVLPLLIGKGTRIAEYLLEWDKEYRAQLRLGETTDTLDATGTVLDRRSTEHISPDTIRETAGRFRGQIQQVPPMYSAVKIDGVPLYRSARAGKTIAREARAVVIHELDVLGVLGAEVTLRVVCSKGTYIRSLCADIGHALGVGGHLRALQRTRVGPLALDQALTIEELIHLQPLGGLGNHVWPLDEALGDLPALVVGGRAVDRVCHGAPVAWSEVISMKDGRTREGTEMPVRIYDGSGRLLALGRTSQARDHIAIDKVFATDSV